MKVREVLQRKGRDVMTVRPSESVRTLARRLRLAGIGSLIVSEDGRTMIGIVSERDVVGCLAEHGADTVNRTVADIMVPGVITCALDDKISAIARKMTEYRFRHIPVIEDGRLVGVVSIGDIVKHRLEEMELEAGVLRDLAVAAH